MKLLGILLIIVGVALGAFLGLYLCLFGGIIQIIEGAKATPIGSSDVAFGIVRVLLTSVAFWLGAFFPIGLGVAILKD
jgi:hypothetical protein